MKEKPKSSPSQLQLSKETLKELRVRSGMRTGEVATYTMQANCAHTPTNGPGGGSCIRITMHCAK